MLRRYRWPGNVRELENLIRRLWPCCIRATRSPPPMIAGELSEPAQNGHGGEDGEAASLSASIEHHLMRYFASRAINSRRPGSMTASCRRSSGR
jgi:two-component system nitrogen regulation response regulator GlnG